LTTKKSSPKKIPQSRVSAGWTLAPPINAAASPIISAVSPSTLRGRSNRLSNDRP
jgi:hypothetical protein